MTIGGPRRNPPTLADLTARKTRHGPVRRRKAEDDEGAETKGGRKDARGQTIQTLYNTQAGSSQGCCSCSVVVGQSGGRAESPP